MRSRSARRPGRNLFLLFILAAYGAIFMAAPLVSAFETSRGMSFAQAGRSATAGESASAGSSSTPGSSAGGSASLQARHTTFEECDRNNDGMLDKSESAAVPGLSANFERADANKDGRLDKVEFAKALSELDARK